MFAKIETVGSYLPNKILRNDELTGIDTSDEWIRTRTGIKQRHIADKDEYAVDIAKQVATKIIATNPVDVATIDAVLIATASQHQAMPSIAAQVANHIGVKHAFTLDFNAACTGFVYGLAIVEAMLPTNWRRAMLIGVDTMSKMLDWQDRQTCVLFGDGGGGVLFKAQSEPSLLTVRCNTDSEGHRQLYTDGNKWANKPCRLKMNGREVYRHAHQEIIAITHDLLKERQIPLDSIDWCIPHQANARLIKSVAEAVGMPQDRVVMTVEQHANTSAASIPLALDHAIAQGSIKRGDRLLLQAFGAGFSSGAAIIDY